MKTNVGALWVLAMLAGSVLSLFAQGGQPSQPVDPTAQSPATTAPTTPPTFPTWKGHRRSRTGPMPRFIWGRLLTLEILTFEVRQRGIPLGQSNESQEVPRERRPDNGYARQGQKVDSCQTNQVVTIHVRRFEERRQGQRSNSQYGSLREEG